LLGNKKQKKAASNNASMFIADKSRQRHRCGTLEATKNKEQKLIFRSLRANIEFLVFDFSFWVNGFHFEQAENINLF
jgi:hypothetical protein